MAKQREDIVLIHQFLAGQGRFLRVVAGVFRHQPQLAIVQAALFVGFVDAQLHAVARLLAVAGKRARQILDRADNDFVLRHTLLLGQRQAGSQPECRDRQLLESHGQLSPSFGK